MDVPNRERSPPDRVRVLHVDDDHDVAATTAAVLEREGRIEVVTETSAGDGLDRLAEGDVDCVVSDYDMPGTDGIEFLEAVREAYPDLPFLLFTGEGSEAVASDAVAEGATDYIRKGSGIEQYDRLGNRILNAVEQYRAERKRRRDERRFEAVFEDPKMHVGLLAPDGTVLHANRTALDAVGADREAVVGEPFPETPWWNHSGTLQADLRRWIDRAAAAEYVEFEAEHRDRDGDPYRVEGTIRPVTDGAGTVTSLIVSARDVTERAERERTLQRERDRRSALFENAPGPVIAGEIRGGGDRHVVSDVNDAFESTFAFEAAEVVGQDVADVIVPDEDRAAHEAFRDRAAAGETVEAEVERITADGPREFRLTVIPYGTDDRPADGWYAWFTDLTERAERERRIEALHAATRRLTSAETETEVAELATEAAETTLDFPMTAVRLLDGDLLVPAALSDGMRTEAGDERPAYEVGEPTAGLAFERGETVVYEDLADHDFGHDFYHTPGASMYVPIGDYGVLTVSDTEPDAFDQSDVDLAEILAANAEVALDRVERTQKLQRRNERLDEFASVVAHDLRNPLNVLSGSLDLAERTGDPDHFRRCAAAADRMERLIDDLLEVSRQGEEVDDPEPVRLTSIVEACWEAVGTAEATLDPDADLTVRADTNRLKQVLENLLRNAVDHAGPEAAVTVGELGDGRGFYVEDDGPGIPEGERERVFESGYSTAADGTGFGLAIVERIVAAHGWEVRVTEGRLGGARFEISGVSVEPDAECAP